MDKPVHEIPIVDEPSDLRRRGNAMGGGTAPGMSPYDTAPPPMLGPDGQPVPPAPPVGAGAMPPPPGAAAPLPPMAPPVIPPGSTPAVGYMPPPPPPAATSPLAAPSFSTTAPPQPAATFAPPAFPPPAPAAPSQPAPAYSAPSIPTPAAPVPAAEPASAPESQSPVYDLPDYGSGMGEQSTAATTVHDLAADADDSTEDFLQKEADFTPLDPSIPSPDQADADLIAALRLVLSSGASDLHVSSNAPPMIRIDGALRPIEGAEVWSAERVSRALRSIVSPHQSKAFDENLELDFAYTVSDQARFRVNFYQQRAAIGGAFRIIPTEIKRLEQLGVPDTVARFAELPRGLVLVTGPTGSGKSTTLAALIDLVNRTRTDHIVTVEDPIEFMHQNKKALVNQREVGSDTHSFANALKHVLRQDPDVILIGELRDLETISVALTAAETGHLVFATLHTQDAPQTIDRVIDVFPPHQQGQVRAQLAATIQGVVCQTLVKSANGKGRVVATEVMVATPAVANLIREGKTYQIHSTMQAGRELGMFTMDQHLADLANEGKITIKAAYDKCHDPETLKRLIRRDDAAPGQFGFGDSFKGGGI